jgi:HAD superfamily hydrolase (TIGR01509 family)
VRIEEADEMLAVLFDLDGLMFDSEPHSLGSWEAVLKDRGVTLDDAIVGRVLGLRTVDTAQTLVDVFRLSDTAEALARVKTEYQLAHLEGNVPPMPGLVELLDAVDGRGLKKAIATSGLCRYAEAVLRVNHLRERFGVVVAGDQVANGKPAPDLFLTAARAIDVSPRHCLVLEDSVNGVRAAKAAGMTCVAVSGDRTQHPRLAEADNVVASLLDVIPFLAD